MPSSGVETAPALWAALARLRDVSRLVLVAIDKDDIHGVSRLAREADTLVDSVRAYQNSDQLRCDDAREMIEQISAANHRIVDDLQDRMRTTSDELGRARRSRARLKAVKMPHRPANTTLVDRDT
jgi:hypothetical protein